jgi:hypothetical protein
MQVPEVGKTVLKTVWILAAATAALIGRQLIRVFRFRSGKNKRLRCIHYSQVVRMSFRGVKNWRTKTWCQVEMIVGILLRTKVGYEQLKLR